MFCSKPGRERANPNPPVQILPFFPVFSRFQFTACKDVLKSRQMLHREWDSSVPIATASLVRVVPWTVTTDMPVSWNPLCRSQEHQVPIVSWTCRHVYWDPSPTRCWYPRFVKPHAHPSGLFVQLEAQFIITLAHNSKIIHIIVHIEK